MHKSFWTAALVVAFAFVSGCSTQTSPGQCAVDNDCAAFGPGYVCADTQCVTSASDSGTPDSGTADSGTPDSGTPDSGTADSGTPDSGTADSGTPDSGIDDGGIPDSGTTDSGTPCWSDWDCGGTTPACDLNSLTCVQCTASNASACTASQACVSDTCAAADAGGSSDDLSTVISYANSGGLPAGTTVDVTGPLVTYVKPSESASDPSGFFVQAQQSGPALFVEAAAGSVSVGDRVRFTVTSAGLFNQLPVATGISALTTVESGHDVTPLASDVSGVDFAGTSAIDTLAGKLIQFDGYVASSVTPANTGYEQAQLTSAGVSAPSNSLRLYAPTRVFTDDGVKIGCSFSIQNGILWQYFTDAEPAVWNEGELTLGSCATLTVTGAGASSSTGVVVSFSRPLDSSTVSASSFSISGLSVSSATLDASGTQVTLVTTTQTAGTPYTVAVSGTVKDSTGIPLSAPSSASFDGYTGEATLRLTEVDVVSKTADRIELYATSAGNVGGIEIEELVAPSVLVTLPSGMNVAVGDRIVLHLDGSACTETTAKNECAASSNADYDDSVWDVGGSAGIAFSSKVLAVLASNGTVEDAVPFTNPSLTAPGAFATTVSSIETSAEWKSMDGGTCVDTASCQGDSVNWSGTTSDFTVTAQHVATFGPTPDDKTAWFVGSATWGGAPGDGGIVDAGTPDSGTDAGSPDAGTDAGTEVKIGEWNLEWFGDSTNGPTDKDLQQANVEAVMADAGADIWGIEEVVDTTRFANVVSSLPGGYSAVVATDPIVATNGETYSGTQQVAVVYKTSEATLNGAQLMPGADSYDFAGRPPLEVALTFHGTPLYVIALHMKAYDDQTSEQRRANAAGELKSYLDTYRANDRVIVLGDWNDDTDESIATDSSGNYLPSPYANFVSDSSNYFFATTPLTQANTSTTVTNFGNGPIDQHLITNELFGNLESGSATVLHPAITNYGTTTSDHYPTFVYYWW